MSASPARDDWSYRISGLHVRSDFPLAGSIALHNPIHPHDIRIRLGEVPATLDGAVAIGPNWQSAPPAFLLEVPGVVRFLVTAGSDIVVAPTAGVPIADAAIFVVGSGIAIALYQRGAMILHASAVAHGDRAFAFSGASGAGKSTLAALLCLGGDCKMLSDDVAAIDLDGAHPALKADGRRFRLWEDVLDWLPGTISRGVPVRSAINKYHVEFPAHQGGESPPLRAIYMLAPLPAGSDPTIELLPLGHAAFALDRHGYRRNLSAQIGDRARKLEQMARLLGSVPVYLFSRSPAQGDNPRSVTLLKEHWASLA
ncbi:hypothetical protein [Sphingomonas sp. Root1294]|nr:hypothetical protein [Sphingomonas sp. Root1294]